MINLLVFWYLNYRLFAKPVLRYIDYTSQALDVFPFSLLLLQCGGMLSIAIAAQILGAIGEGKYTDVEEVCASKPLQVQYMLTEAVRASPRPLRVMYKGEIAWKKISPHRKNSIFQ
ncbi:MAG: hypothetical protein AAFO03_10675 [Bacteroidota bacterium]